MKVNFKIKNCSSKMRFLNTGNLAIYLCYFVMCFSKSLASDSKSETNLDVNRTNIDFSNYNSEIDFNQTTITTIIPFEAEDSKIVQNGTKSSENSESKNEKAFSNSAERREAKVQLSSLFKGGRNVNSIPTMKNKVEGENSLEIEINCDSDDSVELVCLSDDLENWDAPEEIKKKYPYYQAGYDYEGRPLWVAEFGKYDIRNIVEGGRESEEIIEKYIKQGAYRLIKSLTANGTEEGVSDVYYLVDFEGLDIYQFANPKTFTFMLRMLRKYRQLIVDHFAGAILINTNYVAERVVNLGRNILGRALEKVEVYGTQASKWKPVLRRTFPLESIPTWYGGSSNFKPIHIFG